MPRELLEPNKIFRECDARDLFGFSHAQLYEKIKKGDIPKPHLLSSPPSRARGWWGWEINDWQTKVAAQQEAWATEAKNFYVPKGGDLSKNKKPTPTEPAKPKVEKLKGLKKPMRINAQVSEERGR